MPREPNISRRNHEGIDLRPMARAKRARKRAKRLRDRDNHFTKGWR
jgi:hypothetical protein